MPAVAATDSYGHAGTETSFGRPPSLPDRTETVGRSTRRMAWGAARQRLDDPACRRSGELPCPDGLVAATARTRRARKFPGQGYRRDVVTILGEGLLVASSVALSAGLARLAIAQFFRATGIDSRRN
jgi:hypothetical protein